MQQMKLERSALEAFYGKTIPPEILSRMRSFIKRMKDAERGRGELTEEEGFSLLDEFKKGSRLWSDLDISEDEAIAMLLTALGAENRSWEDSDHLAVMIAEIVLPSFSQNARAFSQACSLASSSACAGLARWLFRFGRLKELDTAAVEKALPHIWRTMAEHPDQRDRHTVIAALGEIGTETALGLLRDLVKSDLSQSPSHNARDDEPETQIPDDRPRRLRPGLCRRQVEPAGHESAVGKTVRSSGQGHCREGHRESAVVTATVAPSVSIPGTERSIYCNYFKRFLCKFPGQTITVYIVRLTSGIMYQFFSSTNAPIVLCALIISQLFSRPCFIRSSCSFLAI